MFKFVDSGSYSYLMLHVLTDAQLTLQYLPIEGLVAFNKVTAELLFGADNPVIKQQRVR